MPSNLAPPALSGSHISSSVTVVNAPVDADDALSFTSLEEQAPAQQLAELDNQLVMQNRILEGAENMLKVTLTDALRLQVESELDMAKSRIEAITNRRQDIQSSIDKGKQVNGAAAMKKRKNFQAGHSPSPAKPVKEDIDDKGDDFRTMLQNASNCVSNLLLLARSNMLPQTTPGASSSTDPLTSNIPEADRPWIDAMSRLTAVLQKNLRVRYELNLADIVQAVIPALADKRSKHCRAAAYRVIRHALVDHDSVKRLGEQALDWYIVKSLNRDSKYVVEKEQVIKLIRTIVDIGTIRHDLPSSTGGSVGVVPLSEPVMRAFIAVAEHVEDPFRPICILTLTEILLIDIDLVARTGGTRFLLHALGEGPVELTPILSAAFLHIVDSPRTRSYFTVGTDIETALSAVTDAYGKGPDHAERMKSCTQVIQGMLRTWSGLMYFCLHDMRALRSVIETLRIPSVETREIILNMFFSLLKIKTPEWYQTFIDGRRLTMYRKNRNSVDQRKEAEQADRTSPTSRLTDHYIALLVLIFTNAGLLDALTSMLSETTTGTNLSRKATLLMAEVLQIANRVLPLSVAARIQAIPQIFNMAADFGDGEHRIIGTSAMSAIDSLDRNRARLQPGPVKQTRVRANSVEDSVRRGQRQVEQAKLKMNMQMDDRTFQSCVLETQVMVTRDYTKWNFEVLQELIEGPLLNPKRMEEAIRAAKFIRRLMSFFHPFSHRFSEIPKIKSNLRWARLGCSLLTTLLASPDGMRFLSTEDQFLTQIVKSFAQLDPFNGLPDQDPIFSKKRVAETLTYGYLEMLGTLSKHKEGIELLEKFKIFTAFYHLSELRSREDLIKGIIENLDYSIDGHPRIILSKALTSSYKHIRLYATQHLGDLIRGSANNANVWTLRLLLTQLYDPAPEVCEMAARFLEEACESKEILQLVVEMRPTMDHLGEIGNPLLLKFTSTPMGFRYLLDAGYIDRELDLWFNERNLYYVVQVEVFLSKVFHGSNTSEEEDETLAFEGTVPPHFYGEMSKTELGCQILQEKGHFSDFTQFIRQHGLEGADMEIIMKLKSILWAVGNVGATEGGLSCLEEEDIIPAVLDIANNSPIPSVRGTCFFVLGLISSTSQGAEILDDYEWEATVTPLGLPIGLCIPMDVEKFITIPPWTQHTPESHQPRLIPPASEVELEVITALQNLSNSVIANAASRTLTKMKSRPEYRAVFSSPTMFFRALHMISTQRYRLPVRRYIMDLFTVEMDSNLITKLSDVAKALEAQPDYKPPKSAANRVSIFNRLGRTRRPEESDDEGEDDGPEAEDVPLSKDPPPISCRPIKFKPRGRHLPTKYFQCRTRQLQDFKMVRYAAAATATNPEKTARARGEYLRTHFKNMREVAAALSGLKLSKAYTYLADVQEHKQIIPFRRFAGGVGRASQAKQFKATQGRWPEKSVKFILRLLKNAESNADAKNIDVDDLTIKNIVVQQAPKTRRRTYRAHGRINPYQGHPTHVEIILTASDDEVEKASEKAGVSLVGLNRRQVARKRIEAARA
ncbi:Rapamycin-insensitive companion of mTOR, N-term-domain-containing protein [Armillaria luteobubalina]|uniref:Rapamycin-insensitive companion of mTOR, N-term-domain-containing protein n=1 Tax=Armillaria luteobubalina TaxID=153913 RepID=A0AA39QLP6_9AGAR|nr:Rapamycin-insensitive companion of mTOR, N-term-domain-containing protein [Armillaria luteobubalina]